MSDGLAILVGIALLGLNAFFVGAEFALLSSRQDRLQALLANGHRRARTVLRATREMTMMLAGAQLGITACSIGLGRLAEPALAHQLERVFGPIGIPAGALHPVAFVLALLGIGFIHILLGEMVPKNLALSSAERLALWLVPPHAAFVRATRPVVRAFNAVANGVLRLARIQPKDELSSAYTSEEIATVIGESREHGMLEESTHRRLAQALSSVERTVADVLVPLRELTTLPNRPSVGEVEHAVAATGFSRYPVTAPDGSLIGYLHVKDLLDHSGAAVKVRMPRTRVRPLPRVAEDARLGQAITLLQQTQCHLGEVVDGNGVTVGVVALEDLFSQYVGRLSDRMHTRTRATRAGSLAGSGKASGQG